MSPFKKLLVPTDFSPCAERALDYAMRMVSETGAEVVLLHVFAFPYDWYYRAMPGVESLKKEVEEVARSHLRKLASSREKDEVTITQRLDVNSHVSKATLAAIEDEAPDLVVMGTKGWREERPQLGTVAEQIACHAGKLVLMVPGRAAGFSESPRILVPLYASRAGATSLQFGGALAETLGGCVDILHILPDAPFGPSFLGDEPVEAEDLLEPEQRLKRINKFAAKHLEPATPFTVHLGEGDLVEEVARFVEDERVDLVVLARSDDSDRPHKAELVAQRVDSPVLVVPPTASLSSPASAATPHTHSALKVLP